MKLSETLRASSERRATLRNTSRVDDQNAVPRTLTTHRELRAFIRFAIKALLRALLSFLNRLDMLSSRTIFMKLCMQKYPVLNVSTNLYCTQVCHWPVPGVQRLDDLHKHT